MSTREASDFPPFIRRMLRAYGRRVADCDPVDLAAMVALRKDLDDAIAAAVQGQKDRHSWTDIADALGVSRQAARQKWGIDK